MTAFKAINLEAEMDIFVHILDGDMLTSILIEPL
jgi:hypothetical protein